MSDHLSALALDELAAGHELEEAKAHLEGCADCRARLDSLRAQYDQIAARPEFAARFEALAAKTTPARPARWPRFLTVVLPLAAALAVIVLFPRDGEDTRLKGAPTVELLAGDRPTTHAKPGDRLTLALGGAGRTHAAAFAVDAEGQLSVLWPNGETSAPIGSGARVPVGRPFEVTAGNVVVIATFGDRPRSLEDARHELELALAEAVRAGKKPVELDTPPSFAPSARVLLEVAP